MKIWHDDVRPAPEGWTWCKTNEAVETILLTQGQDGTPWVTEISLDHDLGAKPADGIYAKGQSPNGTGYDLVKWMVENILVPEEVTIHSWNPIGARKMAARLNEAGYDCVIEPYKPKGWDVSLTLEDLPE